MEAEKKTYGETVVPTAYGEELQFHQYIPQADAAMCNEIEKFATQQNRAIRVLDVGMGPGRLTQRLAKIENVQIVGLDNSPAFVSFAKENRTATNVEYVRADFLSYETDEQYDAMCIMGVWHHVPLALRPFWVKKMHSLLSPGGVLVIGDEFIPEYENDAERVHRVGLFYLHIIGEALKIKNAGLAHNECINFLADTLHEEQSRGYFDEALLSFIEEKALYIHKRLFTLNDEERIGGGEAACFIRALIEIVRARSRALKDNPQAECIDRGDYKISPVRQTLELSECFTLENRRDSGPVDSIGGLSVLTFKKKDLELGVA